MITYDYVWLYVCRYVRMYVCTYVRMYVCRYVGMYVCTYVRTYVCMYVRMYVCMYLCMHAYVCVCIYIHTSYTHIVLYSTYIYIVYIYIVYIYTQIYPPVIKHHNGKSTINGSFSEKIIYKWRISHCHVWLPEGTWNIPSLKFWVRAVCVKSYGTNQAALNLLVNHHYPHQIAVFFFVVVYSIFRHTYSRSFDIICNVQFRLTLQKEDY